MIALFALVVLAQVGLGIDRNPLPAASKQITCATAADPAIESAMQEKADTKDGVDVFLIHLSILNRGSVSQKNGAKQVVAIYNNEDRIAQIKIPALDSGEAYAFTTRFKRAADAGDNSTTLVFRLTGTNYGPRSFEDCNDRDNSFRLTF